MMLSAEQKAVAALCGLLSDPMALQLIDCLKNGPATPVALSNVVEMPLEDVMARLTALRKNGMIAEFSGEEEVHLSPFGMYGARKMLQEFLTTTHEDGQCGCSN